MSGFTLPSSCRRFWLLRAIGIPRVTDFVYRSNLPRCHSYCTDYWSLLPTPGPPINLRTTAVFWVDLRCPHCADMAPAPQALRGLLLPGPQPADDGPLLSSGSTPTAPIVREMTPAPQALRGLLVTAPHAQAHNQPADDCCLLLGPPLPPSCQKRGLPQKALRGRLARAPQAQEPRQLAEECCPLQCRQLLPPGGTHTTRAQRSGPSDIADRVGLKSLCVASCVQYSEYIVLSNFRHANSFRPASTPSQR